MDAARPMVVASHSARGHEGGVTAMASVPARSMSVAAAMTVSLTPALSQRARGIRSALRATLPVTR
jgi:hypothetical protein